MAHGTADQIVRYGFGKKSKQLLKDWGWDVRWRKYKGLAHDFRHDEEASIWALGHPSRAAIRGGMGR